MLSPRDFLHIVSSGALIVDTRGNRALFAIRDRHGDINYEFPQAEFAPTDIVSPYYATSKRALFDFIGINLSCFTVEETSSLVVVADGGEDDGHGLAIVKLTDETFHDCVVNHIPIADAAIRKHANETPTDDLLGLEWIGLDTLRIYLKGNPDALSKPIPALQTKLLLSAVETGAL